MTKVRTIEPYRDRAPKERADVRCCWVCGKVGGLGFTSALRGAGYRMPMNIVARILQREIITVTKKAPRPLDLQFDIAINWLQCNEGDIEENTACKAVADWLVDQQLNGQIKEFAKDKGVSVAAVRKAMKKVEKRKQ